MWVYCCDHTQPYQPLSVGGDTAGPCLDGSAPQHLFDDFDKGGVLKAVKNS